VGYVPRAVVVTPGGALTVARPSMAAGGHVPTGTEDNARLDKDTLAPSDAALVRQVVAQMEAHGHGGPDDPGLSGGMIGPSRTGTSISQRFARQIRQ
jgi:hypothetical protein